jgi:hypothetical protein
VQRGCDLLMFTSQIKRSQPASAPAGHGNEIKGRVSRVTMAGIVIDDFLCAGAQVYGARSSPTESNPHDHRNCKNRTPGA